MAAIARLNGIITPVVDLECTIVSIVPLEIREYKPGLYPGHFNIPASKNGELQILHVGTIKHFVYIDESRGSLPQRDPSNIVAESIVMDWIHSQMGLDEKSSPGLFWVPGHLSAKEIEEKYAEQIAEIRILQKNWMTNLCEMADDDWNKYQRRNVISDFQRECASTLGLNAEKHPWMNLALEDVPNIAPTIKCPACKSDINPEAVICPVCRYVVDGKKHKTMMFVTE